MKLKGFMKSKFFIGILGVIVIGLVGASFFYSKENKDEKIKTTNNISAQAIVNKDNSEKVDKQVEASTSDNKKQDKEVNKDEVSKETKKGENSNIKNKQDKDQKDNNSNEDKKKMGTSVEKKVNNETEKNTAKNVNKPSNTKVAVNKKTEDLKKSTTVAKVESRQVKEKGFNNPELSNSSQVLLVTTNSMRSSYANIKFYQKENSKWKEINSTSGRVGSNGLAYKSVRRQSTNTTPAGVLGIIGAFGVANNPGCNYSYKHVQENDYWDLNDGSKTYNRLIHNNPGGDFEHLIKYPTQYKYAFITNYNVGQTPGKGGAIFIHCNGRGATGGCVSMPSSKMVELMRWLKPNQNPKVVIIPNSDLNKYWN